MLGTTGTLNVSRPIPIVSAASTSPGSMIAAVHSPTVGPIEIARRARRNVPRATLWIDGACACAFAIALVQGGVARRRGLRLHLGARTALVPRCRNAITSRTRT